MPDFVHLHTHSDFSILAGIANIDGLIRKAASMQMPALALTDSGNLFGAMEFYTKAARHNKEKDSKLRMRQKRSRWLTKEETKQTIISSQLS